MVAKATVLAMLLPPVHGTRLQWQPSRTVTFAVRCELTLTLPTSAQASHKVVRWLLFRLMLGMGLKKFYLNEAPTPT